MTFSFKRNASDVALLLLSFVLRLAAGMVVLVMLARVLGREPFGHFVYWLAMATLITVPVNLGLGTYVLREIGVDRHRFGTVMAAALTTKLLIAALILLAAAIGAIMLPPQALAPFALLILAQLFDSFTDFFNLGFRPGSHYKDEAKNAIVTSLLHLFLMGVVVLNADGGVTEAAFVFCLSRGLGCSITKYRAKLVSAPVILAPLTAVLPLLRKTWAFALELGQNTAYSQVDSLLINASLGAAGVGLYQAGMRLVDGAARLAPVLAQYALPALSRRQHGPEFARIALMVCGGFAIFGGLGALCLSLGAGFIAHTVYGTQFAQLEHLLPLFGLMLALRYLETAVGVTVVAAGLQHIKVWFVTAQLAFVLSVGPYALAKWGLRGWQTVICTSLVGVLLIYILMLTVNTVQTRLSKSLDATR